MSDVSGTCPGSQTAKPQQREIQAKTIAEQGCMNLYVLYDSDEAGVRASENIKSRFSSNFNVYIIDIPNGKDPADLNKQEAKDIIDERLITL